MALLGFYKIWERDSVGLSLWGEGRDVKAEEALAQEGEARGVRSLTNRGPEGGGAPTALDPKSRTPVLTKTD